MMQRPKEKGQTMIYKTLHRKRKIAQFEPHDKHGVELKCTEGCAVPTSLMAPFSKILWSPKDGKDGIAITTIGTYPWSLVLQIFHSDLPSHGDDRKTFELITLN